jgi:glycerophosphoryl diester phosphodiesterase
VETRTITILAHRGGSKGVHRENTFDAFYHALKHDIKCIEMDIRLNHLKGEFYLEHALIHRPKRKKNYFKKILDLIVDEKVTLFCELKTYTLTRTFYAESFLHLIRSNNLEKQVVALSFNPFVLAQLRRIGYKGKICQIINSRIHFRLIRGYIKNTIKPDIMMISRNICTAKMIRIVKNIAPKLFIYVENKPKDWEFAIENGFDGIETDYALKLRNYLHEKYGETFKVA